jgi:flagella basal body P-ring formation protein FlgA
MVALLGFGAALLAAGITFAAEPVDLRDQPQAAGPNVTLGDLFDGAGAASSVVLATAQPGARAIVLDAGLVQRVAHIHGLDWSNPQSYRRLVVALDGVSAADAAPSSETMRPGKTIDALTYAHNLAAGEIVRPEDVIWAKVQAHLVPTDAPTDPSQMIGEAARHTLREGAVASGRDLMAQKVIKKDQVISVAYDVDGVSLKLQGKALGDAAAGDLIQVLNTQSKKTIEAVAVGPGEAVAGPQAEALKSRRFASLQ